MKFIFLLSVFTLFGSVLFMANAYGSAIAPAHQIKAGIPTDEIVCNDDLVRLFDSVKNRAICVTSTTGDILVKRGWTKAPDLAPEVSEIQNTIKSITITKVEPAGAKKSSTAIYDYVFEICAGAASLIAPEVVVKSDVQTKTVKLATDVSANSCRTSAISVVAVESGSIKAELTKQDDIVSKIASIKMEIDDLTQQLEAERKRFTTILAEPTSEANRQKMSDSTVKINALRQSTGELKDDLNRFYFILYNVPKAKASEVPKLSFSGAVINGSSVKIISTTPAKTEGIFDIVLEVCAGQKAISNPIVDVSSDKKQQTLKLTTVIANSCYKTGAKTDATSADTITAGFNDSVSTIADLEDTIKSLERSLTEKRTELSELTENTVNPDTKRIRQLADEMSSLRDQVLDAKSRYYQGLYKAYKG